MGHYDDAIYEVYCTVEKEGLKILFDKQISKMKSQDKHQYKTVKDRYEYALYRVKGGEPKDKY